ncbi:MAG TPA: dihydroorotate dehydrogenase [Actinomycetota bacterium]|nr:dihydroorotate dehydrogenase [Actinomycetota bacterium]
MKPNPAVDLNGLRFPHPVLAASGCLATGHDVPALVELHKLGGVVTRSLTFGASKGWPTPRSAETSSGLLSAVGLQNPGVLDFIDRDLPRLAKVGVPVVASVAGSSLGEYVDVTSAMHLKHGVVAIEVCLSSADDEREGDPFYASPERLVEIVGAVARMARVPVFAKLPPLLPGLVEVAQQCVRAGAFGFTLVDAIPALAVDASRLRTRTATPVGGLSGPAVKPIALAAVYQVARALPQVPIMGVGGIATGEDAVEFLLAGAWAVQVGTALLIDPTAHVEIARGIVGYLSEKGFASPGDLRGRLRVGADGNGSA